MAETGGRDEVITKSHRVPRRPWEVARDVDSIRPALLERLIRHYRTAYVLGYSRNAGGTSQAQKTGHSDPTGDTAADQEWVRSRVAFANDELLKAVRALDAADKALSSVTERGRYERVDNRIKADDQAEQSSTVDQVNAGKAALHKQTRRRAGE